MAISKIPIAEVVGLAALALSVWGCTELGPLELGTCGNDVLDEGEDCDGFDHPGGTPCGATGTARQCRFECEPSCEVLGASCDGYAGCPTGYGCGSDGICRAPSGKFDATFTDLGFDSAPWMTAADFDNDLRDELVLLAPAGLRTHAFGARGEVRSSFELPLSPFGLPAVTDVNGDESRDVVVPVTGGLAVLRGGNGNELEPSIYPSLEIPEVTYELATVNLLPNVVPGLSRRFPGEEWMFFTRTGFLRPALDEYYAVEATHPAVSADMVGPAVAGQLDEMSDTDELVAAYCERNDVHVYAFDIDSQSSQATIGSVTSVSLADDDEVRGACAHDPEDHDAVDEALFTTRSFAARLVHANPPVDGVDSALCCGVGCATSAPGDDHLDLLVAGKAAMHVAYGLGDGTFHSEACELGTVMVGDQEAHPVPGMPSLDGPGGRACEPLASADLDGDGMLDLVTAGGIWLTSMQPRGTILCSSMSVPSGKPLTSWTHAVVADVNADGHRDVVALTRPTGDIDVFMGSSGVALSRVVVPAVPTNREPRVGDFDGDGADDVAMVTQASPLDFYTEALAILWGEPGGVPSDLATLGLVGRVLSMGTTSHRKVSESTIDAFDDLLVSVAEYPLVDGEAAQPFRARYGVLTGSADRQLMLAFKPTIGDISADGEVELTAFGGNAVAPGSFAFSDPEREALVGVGRYSGAVPLEGQEDQNAFLSIDVGPSNTAGSTRGVTVPSMTITPTLFPNSYIDENGNTDRYHLTSIELDGEADQPVLFTYRNGILSTDVQAPRWTGDDWAIDATASIPDAAPLGARHPGREDDLLDFLLQLSPLLHNVPVPCDLGHPDGEHLAIVMLGDSVVPLVDLGNDVDFVVDEGTSLHLWSPVDVRALREGGTDVAPEKRIVEDGTIGSVACMDLDGDGTDELLVLSFEAHATGGVAPDDFSFASPDYGFRIRLESARYEPESDALGDFELVAFFDGSDWAPLLNLELAAIPGQGMVAGDIDGDGVDDLVLGGFVTTLALYGKATIP